MCGSINKKKNREARNICKLCKKKQKEEKGKERTRKVCKLCAKKKKEQERVRWQCREAWKNEETGILKDCKKKCKKCNPCPKTDASGGIIAHQQITTRSLLDHYQTTTTRPLLDHKQTTTRPLLDRYQTTTRPHSLARGQKVESRREKKIEKKCL